MKPPFGGLARGIIVSCQPTATSVWRTPKQVAALAIAAERGGAVAVRIDGPQAVRACKAVTSVPVIAIYTDPRPGRAVAITPTLQHAFVLVGAGADVVALDATTTSRELDGQDIGSMISCIQAESGVPVMADVANKSDGVRACEAGADFVGTSTTGYGLGPGGGTGSAARSVSRVAARGGAGAKFPDLRLVKELVDVLAVPVIAERGYSTPGEVRRAFQLGALAVVVGSAITDPAFLTARFRHVGEEIARTPVPPRLAQLG